MVDKEKESEGGYKYERVHTTLRSKSSSNIQTVNMMNQCSYYNIMKYRGAVDNKRVWNIEANEFRDLYLGIFYKVDCIYHLIHKCHISYQILKYWHSPMLHAKYLAVVTDYDMYLECDEGGKEEEWKVEKPTTFWEFCEKFSDNILN